MDWFENVKGTFKKTADKAYEKSSQLIEVTKLSYQASEIEGEVSELLKNLGTKIYDEYKNNEEISEDKKEICTLIDSKKEEVAALRAKIGELKNVIVCPKCKTHNDQESNYCKKCGEKISE